VIEQLAIGTWHFSNCEPAVLPEPSLASANCQMLIALTREERRGKQMW